MAAKIKICGLKRPEDIRYVNETKPDYAGFVFCRRSKRFVSLKDAEKLIAELSPDIIPVGVFLDNTVEEIEEVKNSNVVKVLQFHGNDSGELAGRFKEDNGLKIWEAIRLRTPEDIQKANDSCADMVLLDNGLGGTGEAFDWSLLNGIERDFFLAGGLNASNIREALKRRPYGVDTSSGVETNGIKDPDRIREFIRLVREEEEK